MQKGVPELPNIVTLLEKLFHGTPLAGYLKTWENLIFSLIIICLISVAAYFASRRISAIPARLQGAFEIIVGGIDDFVCGIMGPGGRRFTPFIGTLFLYILFMNLSGLIPFMKAPTASWSTTLALALCVFIYVQYAALKDRGVLGYIDHLLGRPRGIIAFSVFIPLMMLILHIVSELVRPISLSLRLRSNIWGDDMLIAVLAGFGIKGIPLLFFNFFIIILASTVQAVVFCLLTTIYFALALAHEE
ncbi:MAG: F0F1 ATP synthase subunit A [Candidatus Omnitrophota bacterium]|nr:F0F1 ATP synthase subunit A [Candidatus Omnitrophota bacterium]